MLIKYHIPSFSNKLNGVVKILQH